MLYKDYTRYKYQINTNASIREILVFISTIPDNARITWAEYIENEGSQTIISFNAKNDGNACEFAKLLKGNFEKGSM